MNVPLVIALAAYSLLMIVASIASVRRVKNTMDYLMGGRGISMWMMVATLTGTGIGTGVAVGSSGLAYSGGWAGSIYAVGLGAGMMMTGLMFGKMRRYQFMTISEEVACYYGGDRHIYHFSNVVFFLSQVFWLTVQIMGGGHVISVITGLTPKTGMMISSALLVVTALPGGLCTVAYANVLQSIFIFIGFIALMVTALNANGGLNGLYERVPAGYNSLFGHEVIGYKKVFNVFLALVASIIADPCRRQMLFSCKNERDAKLASVIGGSFTAAIAIPVVIAGMYAYVLNPSIPCQDQAMPWLVTQALPIWLAAMVVIAILSAVFSSGNANAASAGSYYLRHIHPVMFKGKYPKNQMRAIRLSMSVVFVVSTSLALCAGNIVDFVVTFLSVVVSGLSVVLVAGRFWRRATWQGAASAIVAGAAASAAVLLIPAQKAFWGEPAVPAVLAALIAHVTVSLLTKRPDFEFETIVEQMRKEREGLEG
jgi:SSS family solute:Na+ symporter